MNQGPADLQSVALTTELCTQWRYDSKCASTVVCCRRCKRTRHRAGLGDAYGRTTGVSRAAASGDQLAPLRLRGQAASCWHAAAHASVVADFAPGRISPLLLYLQQAWEKQSLLRQRSAAAELRDCITRAHPDLNQGPADLQSAALTTELCTHSCRTTL